jgi:hypothetical protein
MYPFEITAGMRFAGSFEGSTGFTTTAALTMRFLLDGYWTEPV